MPSEKSPEGEISSGSATDPSGIGYVGSNKIIAKEEKGVKKAKEVLDVYIPMVYIEAVSKVDTLKPSGLVRWREENGYSQIRLGQALGVSTITVYRWEKGMRGIPSFLHLALKYIETKGGGAGKKKSKGIPKTNMKGGKKYGKD